MGLRSREAAASFGLNEATELARWHIRRSVQSSESTGEGALVVVWPVVPCEVAAAAGVLLEEAWLCGEEPWVRSHAAPQ